MRGYTSNGFSATRRIRDDVPGVPRACPGGAGVIAGLLIEALEAEPAAIHEARAPFEELIGVVRAVHRGETLVPLQMLGALVSGLIRRRKDQEEALRRMGRLTRREREVLALLARGAGNVAIAEALVISPETARTHIQNVIGKSASTRASGRRRCSCRRTGPERPLQLPTADPLARASRSCG